MERPDFKSGGTRMACLVGSTPTPFRHHLAAWLFPLIGWLYATRTSLSLAFIIR